MAEQQLPAALWLGEGTVQAGSETGDMTSAHLQAQHVTVHPRRRNCARILQVRRRRTTKAAAAAPAAANGEMRAMVVYSHIIEDGRLV